MIAGWSDSSVGVVIDTHRPLIAELPYCLIQSIDSTTGPDLAQMPWAIARRTRILAGRSRWIRLSSRAIAWLSFLRTTTYSLASTRFGSLRRCR